MQQTINFLIEYYHSTEVPYFVITVHACGSTDYRMHRESPVAATVEPR